MRRLLYRMSTPTVPISREDTAAGPSALWLALGFVLAGVGTVLLGPILPELAQHWHLSDRDGGLLFAAKFVGSFLGGVSVPRRLRFGILGGTLFACLGFGLFAMSIGLATGALCLFVGGFGLGQIIAGTNILAGRRYRAHIGSALASLNGLRDPLLTFAALFAATGLGGLLRSSHAAPGSAAGGQPEATPLPWPVLTHFALLLFLYGGLETCMTGWLTTYTLRFSDVRLLGGQSAVVLLWSALTAGRALSSAALRFMQEKTLQRLGLAASALLIAALTTTHHGPLLSLDCLLLGLSLAPFFPTTFAILMMRQPSARAAGFILAVSGLGAALFPWLMGAVSTQTGSLRIAMAVPFVLALALLALSLLRPRKA
jgi:FHS family glucose/mannose:H+ symporter-like MFS transporter